MLFLVLLFAAAVLSLASCDAILSALPEPRSLQEDQEGSKESRQFWAYNLESPKYYRCAANLLAEGEHCLVYGEKSGKVMGGGSLNAALGEKIAAEFDSRIYPLITGSFGDFLDVDGNGKIILLFLDIKDGYRYGSSGYTAGYFDRNDMEQGSRSNRADMLYLDTWPAVPGSSASCVTIAHELQHLINYSLHVGRGETDVWIDEGLSSAAEYLYGGPQQSRINWYNDPRNESILYGNNFFVWDGYWEAASKTGRGIPADPLTNYTTVYLFFQWLRIHAGSPEIYREINDSQYTGYQAVTDAASRWINPGLSNWATLLTTWYTANRLNSTDGLYGYKGQDRISLRPLTIDVDGNTTLLAPGEGVYSILPAMTTPSPDGAHIGYAGIDTGAKTLGAKFPYAGDMLLLTYNGNTNNSRDRESGYVGYAADLQYRLDQAAGMASAALLSLDFSSPSPVPELYQWDGARYFLEERDRAAGQ